jgi:arabinan endo-1,5-alpha-L-arabinosidase
MRRMWRRWLQGNHRTHDDPASRPPPSPRLAPGVVGTLSALACLATWSPAASQYVDIRVHDPTMIRADDAYWLFGTGRGIDVWRSTDMRSWDRQPGVFAEAPTWADAVVPDFRNHIWAPDISFRDGRYHLFYSVSRFGRNTSAIGHASNASLDPSDRSYEWVDHGMVVRSVPGRDDWNAIDPNVTWDDDGTPWLVFGSYWTGMKLVRLAPDLSGPARPQEWHTVAARHRYWKLPEAAAGDPMNGSIEAPFIFRKDGWYYLFVSWDVCCRGPASTYKVVVGRSRAITGPYLDREGEDMRFGGGSLVVRGDSAWAGVGHSAAYTFDGTDYLVFHGYAVFDEGRPKLWIREIEWDEEGWPRVSLD